MKLTERDMKILRFINEFGFCEMPQIEKRFGMKKPRCYQVIRRLIDAKLITHQRIFYGRHGVLYLTKQGAACTDLPPIKGIAKDSYIHQLTVIDIHTILRERFIDSSWLSERRIRYEKFMDGIGKEGFHLPDAILIDPNFGQIAIEVELTMKSKKRLEDILWDYMLHKDIKEVWYYCAPDIVNKVAKIADKMKRISVIPLAA